MGALDTAEAALGRAVAAQRATGRVVNPLLVAGTDDLSRYSDLGPLIQECDDEVKDGGVVEFPPGDYVVSTPIERSDRTTWVSLGPARSIASANPARAAQGARIVGQVNGDLITIRGAGSGQAINHRGYTKGLNFYSDPVAYPLACAIAGVDDLREHIFEDFLLNGFHVGVRADGAFKGLYFNRSYITAQLHGVELVGTPGGSDELGASDCWFLQTQLAGLDGMGLKASDVNSIELEGCRPQVSGDWNAGFVRCQKVNIQGGKCDSSRNNAGGLYFEDCDTFNVNGVQFYGNSADGSKPEIRVYVTNNAGRLAFRGSIKGCSGVQENVSSGKFLEFLIDASSQGQIRDIDFSGNVLTGWAVPLTGGTIPQRRFKIDNVGMSSLQVVSSGNATVSVSHVGIKHVRVAANGTTKVILPTQGAQAGDTVTVYNHKPDASSLNVRGPNDTLIGGAEVEVTGGQKATFLCVADTAAPQTWIVA